MGDDESRNGVLIIVIAGLSSCFCLSIGLLIVYLFYMLGWNRRWQVPAQPSTVSISATGSMPYDKKGAAFNVGYADTENRLNMPPEEEKENSIDNPNESP